MIITNQAYTNELVNIRLSTIKRFNLIYNHLYNSDNLINLNIPFENELLYLYNLISLYGNVINERNIKSKPITKYLENIDNLPLEERLSFVKSLGLLDE